MVKHATSFSFTDETKTRIETYLVGSETISQFAHKATVEKLNRMETRDDRARKILYRRDKDLLRGIVKDILEEERNEI